MNHIWRNCPVGTLAVLLAGLLVVSGLVGLTLGVLPLSPWDVVTLLGGGSLGDAAQTETVRAVLELRLPRILLAGGVGMGLSLSGVIMQAIFRNPMADPYILGISSGASLGAACAVFLGIGSMFGAGAIGVGAFVGAALLSALITAAAGGMRRDLSYFLIFGIALGAVCSGLTGVLIYFGANSTGMDVTLYWLMGSIAAAKMPWVLALLAVLALVFPFFLTQARMLNLMPAGEEAAIPLGRSLLPFVRGYLVLNALLVGMIVMNAGLVGFIGLLVPHFTRMLTGADHRRLVPVAVLLGGIVAVWADILGRVLVTGVDIPLGVMLALFGAPAFIVMLLRRAYRFGGVG